MIRIITDSASDITQEEAKNLGIDVIPFTLSFGDKTFKDGIDISKNRFYEMLIEEEKLPKSSMISPGEYQEYFSRYLNDEIIYIGLSSKLSGSFNAASLVCSTFPNATAVDSLNVAMGEKILVELAIKLRDEGCSYDKIVNTLNEKKKDIRLMALLDTLEYLKKGGRISSSVAFFGKVLLIKPVIAIEDGAVEMVGKARGSKNAGNLLRELINKSGGIDFSLPYSLGYTGLSRALLDNYLDNSMDLYAVDRKDLPISIIGSTIGTHIGPNAIGIAFFKK